MAGTTVDDGDAVIRAFRQAMFDSGFEAHSDELRHAERIVIETMGQSKITVFRRIFDGAEWAAQFANTRFEVAYRSIIDSGGVRPMEHAEDLFGELRDLGVKVCLTTGFSAVTRQAIVDSLRWNDRIDLALSPDDVGRGRPFPDMILTAVVRLGIDDVREVAVAGDTISDLLSGSRSGARIVAGVLTGTHGRETLASAPHTHLLDSIGGLLTVVKATYPQRFADLSSVAISGLSGVHRRPVDSAI